MSVRITIHAGEKGNFHMSVRGGGLGGDAYRTFKGSESEIWYLLGTLRSFQVFRIKVGACLGNQSRFYECIMLIATHF